MSHLERQHRNSDSYSWSTKAKMRERRRWRRRRRRKNRALRDTATARLAEELGMKLDDNGRIPIEAATVKGQP